MTSYLRSSARLGINGSLFILEQRQTCVDIKLAHRSFLSSLKPAWQQHRLLSHVTRTKTPQNPTGTHKDAFDSTLNIPKWGHYASSKPQLQNNVFAYFMVGALGMLTSAGAKATVQGMPRTMQRHRRIMTK